MARITKYDLFRLKVGITAAILGTLGVKIPIELMLNISWQLKLALLFGDVCLGVGTYLGGFFTDNVKREDLRERIND